MYSKSCTTLIDDKQLLAIVLNLCKTFYWIPRKSCQQLFYDYAVLNKIELPPRHHKHQFVDLLWSRKYIDANKELFLSTFANLDFSMVLMHYTISKEVTDFMNILCELNNSNLYTPDNVYNVDEIDIIVACGNNYNKMTSFTDQKAMMSVINAVNANGHLIPPFFVAKSEHLSTVIENFGPDMVVCASETGDIDEKSFANWLRHFKDFAKPSAEKPTFLVMDNNTYHVSLDAYYYCQKHFIRFLVLPPNTWVKIHPLEALFHEPMRLACQMEVEDYIKANNFYNTDIDIGTFVRFYTVSCKTIQRTLVKYCSEAFKAVGIYPADKFKFASSIKSNISHKPNSSQICEVKYVNCIVSLKNTINRSLKRSSAVVGINPKFKVATNLGKDPLPIDVDQIKKERDASIDQTDSDVLPCEQQNEKIDLITLQRMVSVYTQTDKPKLEKKVLPSISISPSPYVYIHTENAQYR